MFHLRRVFVLSPSPSSRLCSISPAARLCFSTSSGDSQASGKGPTPPSSSAPKPSVPLTLRLNSPPKSSSSPVPKLTLNVAPKPLSATGNLSTPKPSQSPSAAGSSASPKFTLNLSSPKPVVKSPFALNLSSQTPKPSQSTSNASQSARPSPSAFNLSDVFSPVPRPVKSSNAFEALKNLTSSSAAAVKQDSAAPNSDDDFDPSQYKFDDDADEDDDDDMDEIGEDALRSKAQENDPRDVLVQRKSEESRESRQDQVESVIDHSESAVKHIRIDDPDEPSDDPNVQKVLIIGPDGKLVAIHEQRYEQPLAESQRVIKRFQYEFTDQFVTAFSSFKTLEEARQLQVLKLFVDQTLPNGVKDEIGPEANAKLSNMTAEQRQHALMMREIRLKISLFFHHLNRLPAEVEQSTALQVNANVANQFMTKFRVIADAVIIGQPIDVEDVQFVSPSYRRGIKILEPGQRVMSDAQKKQKQAEVIAQSLKFVDEVQSASAPAPGSSNRGQSALQQKGQKVKPPQRGQEDDERLLWREINKKKRDEAREAAKRRKEANKSSDDVLVYPRQTVGRLAQALECKVVDVVRALRDMGAKAKRVSDILTQDEAELLVEEFGKNPVKAAGELSPKEIADANAPRRSPVVCVMGHVDHGKTTLLDTLRNSNRAAGEAGGITQSIGAFKVEISDDFSCTFLDTPGHAAFKNMRERGADALCSDIVILVVSAVDGVQPQTLEALKLAKSHNRPIIVAVNKCDISGAEPEKVHQELIKHDCLVEPMGGDVMCVNISAKTGRGIDLLKESIEFTSDLLDLKSNPSSARGYVIESRVDKGLGNVLNCVIRSGSLKVADYFVCGLSMGKVKAIFNEAGKRIPEIGASEPCTVLGIESLNRMDEELIVMPNEEEARKLVENRKEIASVHEDSSESARRDVLALQPKAEVYKRALNKWRTIIGIKPLSDEEKKAADEAEAHAISFIVKADVRGSLEAVEHYIAQLPRNELTFSIVKSGIGDVNAADFEFAQTMKAAIIAFNVSIPKDVTANASKAKVDLFQSAIIYDLMDSVKEYCSARLPAPMVTEQVGAAKVLQVFKLHGKKKSEVVKAAGIRVVEGELKYHKPRERYYNPELRNVQFQVVRQDEVIWTGFLSSMRHEQKDVSTLERGIEGGLQCEDFVDFQEGDEIRCIRWVKQKRIFDDSKARGM